MLDIKDMEHQPDQEELREYIRNPLFDEFCRYMEEEYKALVKIEYSKDVWQKGWNMKFRKAGKSLCVIYPRSGYFTLLVVVGKKEKEAVLTLLPQTTKALRKLYADTKEGNDQRWLMIDLYKKDLLYQDALDLIRIRRTSK